MSKYAEVTPVRATYNSYFDLRKELLINSTNIRRRVILWLLATASFIAIVYGTLIRDPRFIFSALFALAAIWTWYYREFWLRVIGFVCCFVGALTICSAVIAGKQALEFNFTSFLAALFVSLVFAGLVIPVLASTINALNRGSLTWTDTEQCKEKLIKLGLLTEESDIEAKRRLLKRLNTIKELAQINSGNNQTQSAFLAVLFAVITLMQPESGTDGIWYAFYAFVVYILIMFVTSMGAVNSLIAQTVTILQYELDQDM